MAQVKTRLRLPPKSIHDVFSTVNCVREPVLALQQKHMPKFVELDDDKDAMIVQNDVLVAIRLPGTKEDICPGVLNGLNRGFISTFGIFKGIAAHTLHIPRKMPVSISVIYGGYTVTTNYTKYDIPFGTPLVLGEPDILKSGLPLVCNTSGGSDKRIVACLRPWVAALSEPKISLTVPRAFVFLESIYEPWTKEGPEYTWPPDSVTAKTLFVYSVHARAPDIPPRVIDDYYQFKGSCPLRVRAKHRIFYPDNLDLNHLDVEVKAQEMTSEPVVVIELDDERISFNACAYWAMIFTSQMMLSYPPSHVFDAANPLNPVDQERLNQLVQSNMNILPIRGVIMDIGETELLTPEESAMRKSRIHKPAMPLLELYTGDIPPMTSIVAVSTSPLACPGDQFNLHVWY